MQIRTRLTLQFAGTVALILLLSFISIYYFSSNYREQELYSRLKNKALTTAKFLIDVDEITSDLLKIIDQNTINTLPEEKVVIFNFKNEELYNSLEDDTTTYSVALINKIRLEKELRYKENHSEVIGLLFEGKYDRFVVIASAYDKYGLSKIQYLRWILFFAFIISIGVTVTFGFFYSRQALIPIVNVVKQVENITISSLDSRVNEGNGTDEIAHLAIEFNKMLERLEAAFEIQRSFVSNASHELRTPLTAMTGQIEVALMSEKISEESRIVLQSVLEDTRNLNKLSNGLLDLVQASLDISEIKFMEIRADELIGQARAELIKKNKNYKVNMELNDFPEEESKLKVIGNEQLLKIAILNIIENACKYSSNNKAHAVIAFLPKGIGLTIEDKGIGIPEKDLEHIFQPFFRSENAKPYSGHGIGLTLTQRIIKIHRGEINITSELNKGTSVNIFLPY